MSFSLFKSSNFITIAIRVFIMLSGVISSVITAHSLGPKGRGELVSITTFCLTVANFSNLGFPSSNTYHISSNRDLLTPIFYNSFFISLIGGLLGVFIGFIYLDIEDFYFSYKLIYFFFYITTIMLSNFCSNILIAIDKIHKFNILDLVQNSLILFLYLICYFLRLPLYFYLIFTLAGTIFGSLFGFINIRRNILSRISFNYELFKKSLYYALKVFITTFIAFFIAKANIFLLSKTKSVQDVGFFSIALQLYEVIGIIPASISLLLFPYLIKSEKKDRFNNMVKVLKQITFFMIVICISAYLLLPYFIPFIFGKDFIPSIEIAILLLPGAFFLGVMSVVSQYLASCGYPISQVLIWIFALIIWCILSFLFVPTYGSHAVAIIISIINMFIFLLLFIVSIKFKKHEN